MDDGTLRVHCVHGDSGNLEYLGTDSSCHGGNRAGRIYYASGIGGLSLDLYVINFYQVRPRETS